MKLRAAAAILIVYSTLVIQRAMPDLPEQIPTSFNLQGRPTATSRPETLWLLLAGQALIVALLLAVPYIARHAPQWINLGRKRLSDFSPKVQQQILLLLESATGWMAVAFALFFATMIRQLVGAAMDPSKIPGIWIIPVFFVGLLGILGFFAWKYLQLEKDPEPSSAPRRFNGTYPSSPRNSSPPK